MRQLHFLLLIGFTLNLSAQDQTQELLALMQGSFNSGDQATSDSTYYNISLHMYPIWEGSEGNWLYVEQALFSMQDKPYRQRIYKVEKIDEQTYASRVYTIENEEVFIGKCKAPGFFDSYDQSILKERTGCAVILNKVGKNTFEGQTRNKDCASNLRGAAYATSIVKIEEGLIESWDQGFDANDTQVWGAEKGGYIFKKN